MGYVRPSVILGTMSFPRFIACALLALLVAGPVTADQNDSRLPGLFKNLLSAVNPEAAQVIEVQIWHIWFQHGDNAVVLLMEQGEAAMGRQDYESALRSFNQVIQIAPEFAEGWNRRATLYYLMRRYDDSLADIDKTLALEPRHFGALAGRGLVYSAMEELDLALDAFEAALAVNPHMVGPRINAEAIRKNLGDRDI